MKRQAKFIYPTVSREQLRESITWYKLEEGIVASDLSIERELWCLDTVEDTWQLGVQFVQQSRHPHNLGVRVD